MIYYYENICVLNVIKINIYIAKSLPICLKSNKKYYICGMIKK